jgi:hypothetical protein
MESLKALDKGLVERMHEGMLRIRLFEETQSRVFKAGLGGFTHLYLGGGHRGRRLLNLNPTTSSPSRTAVGT